MADSQSYQVEQVERRRQLLNSNLRRDGLTCTSISGYSIGHVYNDLCAAVWFNYLLFYVKTIIDVPSQYAGYVVLSGQIADGIMTPIVGVCSDRTNTKCGKRTPWFIFGTILVAPCFFGIFWDCALCQVNGIDHTTALVVYYTVLPAVFNIGWASVQISNMSLNAQLSMSTKRRDKLINYRTAFTYISNFLVLLCSFVIFYFIQNGKLGFKYLDLSVTIAGIICTVCYLIFVPQVRLSREAKEYDAIYKTQRVNLSDSNQNDPSSPQGGGPVKRKRVQWRQWLKRPVLYVYGFLYMFVRLSINVYSVLQLGPQGQQTVKIPFQIALVPLINYICSSIFSLFLNKRLTNKFGNRNIPFLISIVITAVGIVPYFFLKPSVVWPVYICSGLIGVGFSIMLNTAVSCINDVIGQDAESGAFVFGIYSFFDKISNGIVLFFITAYGLESRNLIRIETTLIVLICAGCSMIFMLIGTTKYAGQVRALSYHPVALGGNRSNTNHLIQPPTHSSSIARFGTVDHAMSNVLLGLPQNEDIIEEDENQQQIVSNRGRNQDDSVHL